MKKTKTYSVYFMARFFQSFEASSAKAAIDAAIRHLFDSGKYSIHGDEDEIRALMSTDPRRNKPKQQNIYC